jgi:hypothetical protein
MRIKRKAASRSATHPFCLPFRAGSDTRLGELAGIDLVGGIDLRQW